jgi:diguanylate cyclase (GGDEF)-like protein
VRAAPQQGHSSDPMTHASSARSLSHGIHKENQSSRLPIGLELIPEQPKATFAIPAAERTPSVLTALHQLKSQIDSLRADRARLVQRLREAEDLADTDTLVPVFNRRAFVRELTRVMSFAERYDVQASLVYFDLDGFKQVNDRFGHSAGDAVLKAIGQVLLNQIRESDLVGRVGGDEFAVILAKAGPADARAKGSQLAQAIRDTAVPYLGHKLSVGAAFGAYTFGPGDTAERALSRADEAMYSDKVGRKVQSL